MITGKNWIGNQLLGSSSKIFYSSNPKENANLEPAFYQVTTEELEIAVKKAEQAFDSFNGISPLRKASFFSAIKGQLLQNQREILEWYCLESGLSYSRAQSELNRTILQIDQFTELVKENFWREASIDNTDQSVIPQKPDVRKMNIAIGPVVVFGASNFPLAYSTIGGDTISALAAGCPVIVKSHPLHPATGELVANAIIQAAILTSMPDGVFSNLNGLDFSVGEFLVKHPKVKAVAFTGSFEGGMALYKIATNRPEPIPIFAEMGSINPIIICNENIEHYTNDWTTLIADSVANGAGQFCTKPGLIFIIDGKGVVTFIENLKQKIINKNAECMLSEKIYKNYIARKNTHQAKIEIEGIIDFSKGNFASPNVGLTNAVDFLNDDFLIEEVFGPYTLIVRCRHEKELVSCLNKLKGSLTGTVFADLKACQNLKYWLNIMEKKVGRLLLNAVPTGVTVCPSMHHGGPFPATTDSRFTSVGIDGIKRFIRPCTYQNIPDFLLPEELQNKNPLKILRRINGNWTFAEIIS